MKINYDKTCRKAKVILIIAIKDFLYSKDRKKKEVFPFHLEWRTDKKQWWTTCMAAVDAYWKSNGMYWKKVSSVFLSADFTLMKAKIKLLIIAFHKRKQTHETANLRISGEVNYRLFK